MTIPLTYKDLQYFTEHEVIVLKTPEGRLAALRPPEGTEGNIIVLAQAPAYAEIRFGGNAVASTVAAASTWYQLDKFDTNGESNVCTPEYQNNHIVVERTATYMATIGSSVLRAGGAACVIECELWSRNGVKQFSNVHWDVRLGTAVDISSATGVGIIKLEKGDTVEVWFQNKTNTTDITFEDVSLAIVQIGQ
jgi:hypothetical protein